MNALAGTGALVRLALRRDRVRLPVWILLPGGLPCLTAVGFAELYPTEHARAGYATGVAANPALLALQGPVFGSSLGAITAARTLGLSALLVGLMSLLTVVRHTRAEEEAGRHTSGLTSSLIVRIVPSQRGCCFTLCVPDACPMREEFLYYSSI